MMRRIIGIIAILLFVQTETQAQQKKGNMIINLSGGYDESQNSNIGYFTSNGEERKLSSIALSNDYALGNSLMLGIGLEYVHAKQEGSYFVRSFERISEEYAETTSNVLVASLSALYFKNITDKLFFSVRFRTGYGEVVHKTNATLVESSRSEMSQVLTYQNEIKQEIFLLSLQPELNYMLTKQWGLQAKMGGLWYTLYDFDTEQSQFKFIINPVNWEFGVFYRFRSDSEKTD